MNKWLYTTGMHLRFCFRSPTRKMVKDLNLVISGRTSYLILCEVEGEIEKSRVILRCLPSVNWQALGYTGIWEIREWGGCSVWFTSKVLKPLRFIPPRWCSISLPFSPTEYFKLHFLHGYLGLGDKSFLPCMSVLLSYLSSFHVTQPSLISWQSGLSRFHLTRWQHALNYSIVFM